MKRNNPIFKSINYLLHLFEESKTFALIGKSGTGKSYRAQEVANRYYIDLIIDDGLLIKDNKILSGYSAKQEENYLGAVRVAIFDTPSHRNSVANAIKNEFYPRILVIGTSKKMVDKIVSQLNLPPICKYIKIEDIADQKDIETAKRIRYTEGKHIIPVSGIEITRRYPNIAHSLNTDESLNTSSTSTNNKSNYEKTVVTPKFSKKQIMNYSNSDIKSMIENFLHIYNTDIIITSFDVEFKENNSLNIALDIKDNFDKRKLQELKNIITDSLEHYANLIVNKIEISFKNE